MFVISRSLVQVRQPAPVLKRTIWCVFYLDVPAFLIFMFGVPPVRGGQFYFIRGAQFQPISAPRPQNTKTVMQSVMQR